MRVLIWCLYTKLTRTFWSYTHIELEVTQNCMGSSVCNTLPKANDRAVMEAYAGSFAVNNGFGAKMTEAEIVGRLFEMYEGLCQNEGN